MPKQRPPRRRVAALPRVRRGSPGEARFRSSTAQSVLSSKQRLDGAAGARPVVTVRAPVVAFRPQTGEASVLDGRRRPGGPGSPPRSTTASARAHLCRVPENRRSEERPHAAAGAAHALRRKPGGADSRPRTGPQRCEEDLMQPGELSRVKEHAPKGAVPDGAAEAARQRI
jgi:hypothetical protein